jgi:hypothetical protein
MRNVDGRESKVKAINNLNAVPDMHNSIFYRDEALPFSTEQLLFTSPNETSGSFIVMKKTQ